MDDIDALLGCSVCLPSSECVDDFVNLSTAHKDLVCRCLFYGVNWFIEVPFPPTPFNELSFNSNKLNFLFNFPQFLSVRCVLPSFGHFQKGY